MYIAGSRYAKRRRDEKEQREKERQVVRRKSYRTKHTETSHCTFQCTSFSFSAPAKRDKRNNSSLSSYVSLSGSACSRNFTSSTSSRSLAALRNDSPTFARSRFCSNLLVSLLVTNLVTATCPGSLVSAMLCINDRLGSSSKSEKRSSIATKMSIVVSLRRRWVDSSSSFCKPALNSSCISVTPFSRSFLFALIAELHTVTSALASFMATALWPSL